MSLTISPRALCPVAVLASTIVLAGPGRADVKLPALFSDSVVLQRDRPLPVWGTADAGEEVTVTLGTASANATAGADGNWKVVLPAQKVATGATLTVKGKNEIALKDVALGDVWICSGQSNMEWSVSGSKNAKEEIAAANFPNLRQFRVNRKPSIKPLTETTGKWVASSPTTAGGFTAVGFFFGRELNQKLDVPIGLIHTSWGGTPAQAWTSREALEADPAIKGYMEAADNNAKNYEANKEKYEKEALPAWQTAVEKAKAEGKPEPRKPNPPALEAPNFGSHLFNGMINPVIPFAIKGAIWYQGESNGGEGVRYRKLFPAMITDWRTRWGQGDFSFYWVQLANFQAVQTKPVEGGWALLREAQDMTLSLPNTGMATAIDLADAENPNDIHPKNKQDVGKRLALIALAKDYGQKVTYSGPRYNGIKVEGNKVRVNFQFTDGGLKAKGEKLQGFAIAGADNAWKWADATIEGNDVVLSSPEVTNPDKVRYGWAMNPIGNLYNGADLPAFPFRSDVESPA